MIIKKGGAATLDSMYLGGMYNVVVFCVIAKLHCSPKICNKRIRMIIKMNVQLANILLCHFDANLHHKPAHLSSLLI